MKRGRFEGRIRTRPGTIRGKVRVLAAVLFLLFAAAPSGLAQCSEKPTVWMSEQTAASHLLASRKFVLPAGVPALGEIRSVVVIATVSRQGEVCEARARSGPAALRPAAERIARSFWRYRPFLLDWKPVAVQFPVTINFVLPLDRKSARTPFMAGVSAQHPRVFLRGGLATTKA